MKNIRQYSQIIGIKQKFAPCFDTVVVDRSEQRIELRVDVPSAHVPSEIQQIASQHVLASFNALSYEGCRTSIVGLSAFDFFPMLLPLYRDNAAGKVSTLGLLLMRKIPPQTTLAGRLGKRATTYGRINSTKVERQQSRIFALTPLVSNGPLWAAKTVIELEIPGSIHCLYKSRALHVANLSGCVTFAEYDFLTSRFGTTLKLRQSLPLKRLVRHKKLLNRRRQGLDGRAPNI